MALLSAAIITAAVAGFPLSNTAAASPPRAAVEPAAPINLALTPPMGWNSWNQFNCTISEDLIKQTADAFAARGLKDAGYEYVNIDDCWQAPTRDAEGRLQANPDRFPSGIKALAAYVHDKGLKLGIYANPGARSCAQIYGGYPGSTGSLGHERIDAETFASWDVDYLKYDWCLAHNQGLVREPALNLMRDELTRATATTNRKIVYSTNPDDQLQKDWSATSNLWRTTLDIENVWDKTNLGVINKVDKQVGYYPYARPGHWNDPDMLEVGVTPGHFGPGLSDDEARSHFGLWAMMAAPLIIGADVRKVEQKYLDILGNADIVAVDQDALGKQGVKVRDDGNYEIFAKPLENGDVAVALLNRSDTAARISTTATEAGLPAAPHGYLIKDLWTTQLSQSAATISASVPAHGTAMLRIAAAPATGAAPPALALGLSTTSTVLVGGQSAPVTATVTNYGSEPISDPTIAFTLPAGWTATQVSGTSGGTLTAGSTSTTGWTIQSNRSEPTGTVVLRGVATGTHAAGAPRAEAALTLPIRTAITANTKLGDVNWLSASNGWGPVERNQSNGEEAAGDGRRITLKGTVYPTGIGTHAAAAVGYYLGGTCSRFSSSIGIDDESSGNTTASVVFQVFNKDTDTKIYDSGVVAADSPTRSVDVAVAGIQQLELRVTDAGNGNAYDHADWAGARVACSATGVEDIGSAITLAASSDRQTYRSPSPVTLTAEVALSTDDPATGQVEFLEGDQVLATKPVKDGAAAYPLPATVAVGSHDYSARFVPSRTTMRGSTTAAPVRVEVVAIGSSTTLAVSRTGQVFGSPQPLALTAKVTLADRSPADGTVVFTIDGAVRARVPVADDLASYTLPSSEPAGVKELAAQFVPADGDTVSGSSAPGRSVEVTPSGSNTRLKVSAPNQVYGSARPVTATATVDLGSGGRPQGTVQFRLGTKLAATVKLDADGEALYRLSRTEPAGRKAVTATFVPKSATDVRGSASAAVNVTVKKATSTTTLTAAKKSQVVGNAKSAKVTATVKLDAGTPQGRMVFRVDGTIVKTVGVTAGKATYQLSKRLRVGRHKVTAEFVPTEPANVLTSTSRPVTITVRGS
jgi:alpha-galactosidase